MPVRRGRGWDKKNAEGTASQSLAPKASVQGTWKTVHPNRQNRVRLQEDTHFGMDGVHHKPRIVQDSFPFVAHHHEHEKHWPLLDFQDIRGPERMPGRRRALRERMDDEAFFKQTKPGFVHKNGKKPSGLTRNLFCVATVRDEAVRAAIVPCGRGGPIGERMLATLGPHIRPGSRIMHDSERPHSLLISKPRCSEKTRPTTKTKRASARRKPDGQDQRGAPVPKKFMARHGGFDRNHLADWMNLFWLVFTCFGKTDLAVNGFLGRPSNAKKSCIVGP